MPIGIDIVELARIEQIYRQFGHRFVQRILTEEEQKLLSRRAPISFLAGRFAAKEAIKKAVCARLPFKAIAVLPDGKGRPEVFIRGQRVALSISLAHERHYAVAVALKESA